MSTIHEFLGRRAGVRSRSKATIDAAYKVLQRPGLFLGGTKRYTPFSEEDPVYPNQDVVLQANVYDVLERATGALSELFDITFTVDRANAAAVANIVVDGDVLAENVPAVTLIAIEKRLTDLHTMIESAPTLDPAELWDLDSATGTYRSRSPQEVLKTKKVVKYVTVFAGDERHAPDIRERAEDVPVGKWTSVNFSGCLSAPEKLRLLGRVDQLRAAVREARERANAIESDPVYGVGDTLMNYVMSGN
jgi:hypothetical protein